MPARSKPKTPSFGITDKIDVLFQEYQALYRLAEFRLVSLDRRALAAWAALTAFLTTFTGLNPDAQVALLLGAPMAVLWLLRTTINHARSFEDALRRLDEIECTVNRLAGEELLAFQSRHPSRGGAVGGRTGRETVLTVLATGIVMLGACAFLFWRHGTENPVIVGGYLGALIAVGVYYVSTVAALGAYRYLKANVLAGPSVTASGIPSAESLRTRGTPASTPDRMPL